MAFDISKPFNAKTVEPQLAGFCKEPRRIPDLLGIYKSERLEWQYSASNIKFIIHSSWSFRIDDIHADHCLDVFIAILST